VREVAEIGWLRTMSATLTRPIPAVCVYAPSLRHVRLQASGYHFLATDTAARRATCWRRPPARR